MSAAPPLIIPLSAVPSQTLNVTLNNQSCQINIYAKNINVPHDPTSAGIATTPPTFDNITPIFLDLYVNDEDIITGVLCLNEVLIVRNTYLGFIGDLCMVDTQGAGADPGVSGLGTRWQLVYLQDSP